MLAALVIAAPAVAQQPVRQPLADRIAHTNPALFQQREAVHGGAGPMAYMGLLGTSDLETNLYFLHRGQIPPGGGIGGHFHNTVEEMFVIFDGEAEFTINGRTSLLKGPAGAPCRLGSSHAIYNPTDKPVQWMNINVSVIKGEYDAFNLDDPRVGVPLDPIPVFMTMRLDRTLLRGIEAMFGGKGTAQYRRALAPTVFGGPWAYVDHLLLPPGASTGGHVHRGVAEFYYVMSGDGTVTVASSARRNGPPPETAAIKAGDAIPIQLSEGHSFANTGTQPLEFLIVGVARESTKDLETIDLSRGPN
jgi:mannose-6-phosphate isomerase-like protein (cupin superfamily)